MGGPPQVASSVIWQTDHNAGAFRLHVTFMRVKACVHAGVPGEDYAPSCRAASNGGFFHNPLTAVTPRPRSADRRAANLKVQI